ncbi:AAA family ATPase [Actinomadura sp. KC345]|uniref:AAA family ATPase n=1 Tax=Actinomadura sp. KC345 TaxID=2530371 RepID=UPI00104BF75E|nr:AAA family ATPase [Actinomadura sp. KC345]TDC50674.1 AAA family ATPase [Actinomadura sp. KC345]
MRLPEHLELLVSEGPVIDLYAFGPWRAPDGLYEEIRGRVDALVQDPRSVPLTTGGHGMMTNPASLVAAEMISFLAYLPGAVALYSGAFDRLYHEFFGRYLPESADPASKPSQWSAMSGEFRAFEWLEECGDQDLALTLGREALGVFEGLAPFETRRRAMLKLFDDPPAGDWLKLPLKERRELWAAQADDDVIAALPELAGPISHLEWVCSGLLPVHEHLREIAPHDETADELLVHLMLQADLEKVPAELSVCLTEDRFGALLRLFEDRAGSFDANAWSLDEWAWLARALGAGGIEACRGWLDMAMRFTGSVRGLPGVPSAPNRVWIPIGGFQEDVHRLFTPRRRIANPLAAKLGKPAAARPSGSRGGTEVETDLVGQPDVTAALEEIAAGAGPVRLMIVGPDGTGKRDAAQEIVRLVQQHGVVDPPLWLSGDFFAAKEVSSATSQLYAEARDSAGVRLMVIDGLDDMSKDERSGEAILEQLHQAVDVHEDLHVVVLCEPGGDERIRELNPALALRFQVVPTHPFTADGHAELFNRALQQRGARAHKRALTAAGELLARTPPLRNLRNARLSQRLADIVVEAVRERTEPGQELVVKRPDVPASFGSSGADPMAELEALTGLGGVKHEIELLIAGAKAAKMRRDAGVAVPAPPARHMVFTGNPGTGKTVVARLFARILKDLGVLTSGHLVEATRSTLVGTYIGETAVKTRKVAQRAVGGVLFIDEAYSLFQEGVEEDYGPEAVAELLRVMENHRDDLVVIVAGYEREMRRFIASDPGLASRFPSTVRFPDFADTELIEIFTGQVAAAGLELTPDARDRVADLLRRAPRGRSFGNARVMRNLCERAAALQARRVTALPKPTPDDLAALLAEDIPDTLSGATRVRPVTDPLADLDALIGLADVKREVHRLAAEARAGDLRRAAGQPVTVPSRHMVFTGNPGTAKTTVARLIASLYADLGLLSSGHLVEVSRADLVGSYVGQTAPRVRAAVEQALGGVLFIDEAYSLSGDSYTQEAVSTLVQLMEEYRTDLVVIAAGYEREMKAFLSANSGLESRFPKRLAFPDYSDDELVEIFTHLAAAEGLQLAEGVPARVRGLLRDVPRGPSFGNGRLMRNILDAAVATQSERLTASSDASELSTLSADDLRPDKPASSDKGPGLYL